MKKLTTSEFIKIAAEIIEALIDDANDGIETIEAAYTFKEDSNVLTIEFTSDLDTHAETQQFVEAVIVPKFAEWDDVTWLGTEEWSAAFQRVVIEEEWVDPMAEIEASYRARYIFYIEYPHR